MSENIHQQKEKEANHIEQQQQKELEERLWLDSNLSRFDEILRLNFNKSIEDFSNIIIYHIAKLMNAVRGSFFIVDYDISQIIVSGAYGTLLHNMKNRKFEIGEGPIGQAVKSKMPLFFDELPAQNSVVYTSLASINSTFLIIKPLQFNDVVYGVMELSILKRPEEKYINLLREVSKNIATMLQSIQSNQKTKTLLREAQYQTEMLQAQEEEMRQNMEELTTTQEEMVRKQRELELSNSKMKRNEEILKKSFEKMREQKEELKKAFDKVRNLESEADQKVLKIHHALEEKTKALNTIHRHVIQFTLNAKCELLTMNELGLHLLHYQLAEIQNQHYHLFLSQEKIIEKNNQTLWETLRKNKKPVKARFKFRSKDQDFTVVQGVFALVQNAIPEQENYIAFYGIEIPESHNF